MVARLQRAAKRRLGFTLPTFHGKGIFLTYGFLPYQTPMNIVVGRPIDCPQVEEPSQVRPLTPQLPKLVSCCCPLLEPGFAQTGTTRFQHPSRKNSHPVRCV